MANVLAVVAFVLGVVIPASCLGVWTAVMLPGPTGRARDRAAARPLLCLAWGVFAVAAAFVLLVLLLPRRDAGFRLFADVLSDLAALSGAGLTRTRNRLKRLSAPAAGRHRPMRP